MPVFFSLKLKINFGVCILFLSLRCLQKCLPWKNWPGKLVVFPSQSFVSPPLPLLFHCYSQSTPPPSLCFSFHTPSVRRLLKVLFSRDMLGVWAAKIQHPARELHVYESCWWSRSFTVINRLRKLSLGVGFILLSLFLSQILLSGKLGS